MFGVFGKKIPKKKPKPIVDESGKTNLSADNAARALQQERRRKKKMLDEAGNV